MPSGVRRRGICNDLQASTMAGTPGWRVRLFRLVRRAPNRFVVRCINFDNLDKSASYKWEGDPRRAATLAFSLIFASTPGEMLRCGTPCLPRPVSPHACEITGIYRD